MHLSVVPAAALAAAVGVFATAPADAQGVGMYFAPKDQVVAIRAGKLFDSRNGALLNNHVILIHWRDIKKLLQ